VLVPPAPEEEEAPALVDAAASPDTAPDA
jgi:hypothetical protein